MRSCAFLPRRGRPKRGSRTGKRTVFRRYLVFMQKIRYTERRKPRSLNNFLPPAGRGIWADLPLQQIPARGRKPRCPNSSPGSRGCSRSPRGDGNHMEHHRLCRKLGSCSRSPRGDGNNRALVQVPSFPDVAADPREGTETQEEASKNQIYLLQQIPARGRKRLLRKNYPDLWTVAADPREGTVKYVLSKIVAADPREGTETIKFRRNGNFPKLQQIPARGRKLFAFLAYNEQHVAADPREGTETVLALKK